MFAYFKVFRQLCKEKLNFTEMKRLLTLLLGLTMTLSSFALIYDEAREQAWFLTDKMAYELNLTSQQYDAVYQINLEYFLNVNTPNDVMGSYWTFRKMDLQYVLADWQFNLFTAMSYFLTPIQWTSRWYFPILTRYRTGYYFYDRPSLYYDWRGGLWIGRRPGSMSPFYDRRFTHNGHGLRDRYNHGGHHLSPTPHGPGHGPGPGPGPRPGGGGYHGTQPSPTPSYNQRAQQGRQGNTYSGGRPNNGGGNSGGSLNSGNNNRPPSGGGNSSGSSNSGRYSGGRSTNSGGGSSLSSSPRSGGNSGGSSSGSNNAGRGGRR